MLGQISNVTGKNPQYPIMALQAAIAGERAKRASFEEDENTPDESREIATDIMAASTTKLTHPINSFGSLARFARFSLIIKNVPRFARRSLERP